jgi:hypothetical protein
MKVYKGCMKGIYYDGFTYSALLIAPKPHPMPLVFNTLFKPSLLFPPHWMVVVTLTFEKRC